MVPGNNLRRIAALLVVLGPGLVTVRTTQAAEKSPAKADVKPSEKGNEKAAGTTYLRVVHDARDRPVGLETAIVSFVPAAAGTVEVRVDLVAAVHIADKKYYQELNKRFAGYDVVLYELVAREGTRPPAFKTAKGGRKEKRAGNVLSAVQLGMKDLLGLEFQLDQVDYTQKNLVHADLSGEEFRKSFGKESYSDILGRLFAYSMAKQAQGGDGGDVQLLLAMFGKDRTLAMKRAMADQFQEMESMTAALEGPKGGTLIAQRNKRALEVLKKQIAAGKKKIAIFYGAGHMSDMEKHLRADFALKPSNTQWLQAWDMK